MKIQLDIEQGKTGLFYATSPQIKGLLVAERTFSDCLKSIPEVIANLELAIKASK